MAPDWGAGWRVRQRRHILGPMCGRSTYKLTWEEVVALYRLTLRSVHLRPQEQKRGA